MLQSGTILSTCLILVLTPCYKETFASPQWGVAAAAEAGTNIDLSQAAAATAAPPPASAPVSSNSNAAPSAYPYYNPYYGYYGSGYSGYSGYYPPAQPPPPPPQQQQQKWKPGGWGYQGLPWWGFYGYWKG